MSRRLIDHNIHTGISTYHHYDHSTGQTHIESTQDVKSIIDNNKRLQNQTSSDMGRKNGLMLWATIPNNVIVKLKQEEGIDVFNKDDLKKLERLLDRNPEYKYLKVC